MKTHYEFLGIGEDADADAIRAAYRKCMLRIHPDLHPDDSDAQELAQQMNAASRTLLDEESRQTYDESLQRQRELEATVREVAAEREAAARSGTGRSTQESAFKDATGAGPTRRKSSRAKQSSDTKRGSKPKPFKKKSTFQKKLMSFLLDKIAPLIVGLVCSSVVVFILYCVIKGKHPLEVFDPTKTALTTRDLIVDLGESDSDSTKTGSDADGGSDSLTDDGIGAGDDSSAAMDTDDAARGTGTDGSAEEPVVEVGSFAIDLKIGDPTATETENDGFSAGSQFMTGLEPVQPIAQIPIPSENERAEARKVVTSLFRDRYANAKMNAQRRELAKEIYEVGLATTDDLAGMYELLRISRDLAIETGDIRLSERIINSISKRFQVDQLQASLTAFAAIESKLLDRSAKEYLYFATLRLTDQFESSEAYDKANEACRIAGVCANSLRNTQLMLAAKRRQDQLNQTTKQLQAIEQFVVRQALDSSDAEANFEVGRYLCFWKGQWSRGLDMLAAGTEPALAKAATADLQAIGNNGALDAADNWWAAADAMSGHESEQARARATMFYLRAQETLDGLNRMKVEHRISSVDVKSIAYMTQKLFADSSLDGANSNRNSSGLINSIGMKLIRIPSGQFEMGSLLESADSTLGRGPAMAQDDEQPRHSVVISQPFYMGIYEVTAGQFAAFAGSTGYVCESVRDERGGDGWDSATKAFATRPDFHWNSPGFPQTESHPVVVVSWNDANMFCQWLSGKENKTYRLPTEAEWEYACRAGTQTIYQHADIPHDLERFANALDSGSARALAAQRIKTSGNDAFTYTAPAGSFLPNRFGLYDMHGNVWEWCQDWYEPTYYAGSAPVNPSGPSVGTVRTIRGGGFFEPAENCRSAERNSRFPSYRNATIGFRVVLEVGQ